MGCTHIRTWPVSLHDTSVYQISLESIKPLLRKWTETVIIMSVTDGRRTGRTSPYHNTSRFQRAYKNAVMVLKKKRPENLQQMTDADSNIPSQLSCWGIPTRLTSLQISTFHILTLSVYDCHLYAKVTKEMEHGKPSVLLKSYSLRFGEMDLTGAWNLEFFAFVHILTLISRILELFCTL